MNTERLLTRGRAAFDGSVPALPVAIVRAVFALIVLFRTTDVTRGFLHFNHHGWMRGLEYAPPFDAPVPPLLESPLVPGLSLGLGATLALVIVRTVAACLLLLGVRPRAAAAALAIAGFWLMAADRHRYLHHLMLLWLIAAWLSLVPSGGRLSLEGWLRKAAPESTVPRWPIELLKLQCVGVYLASGVAKLNAPWLSGLSLERLDKVTLIGGPLFDQAVAHVGYRALSLSICVVELALVPLLLWSRTRLAGVVLGASLHLAVMASMEVSTFGAEMCLLLSLFLIPRLHEPALQSG